MPYSRAIFLYMEPRAVDPPESFAQCESCRIFVPPERCVFHGSKEPVDDDDSCGYYVPWPKGTPEPAVIQNHRREIENGLAASVTPAESGLVRKRVQCHRCIHIDPERQCGLYKLLNQLRPDMFDLDPVIHPHGCCNAWDDEPTRPKSFLGA